MYFFEKNFRLFLQCLRRFEKKLRTREKKVEVFSKSYAKSVFCLRLPIIAKAS
jgi:hypothetical protein